MNLLCKSKAFTVYVIIIVIHIIAYYQLSPLSHGLFLPFSTFLFSVWETFRFFYIVLNFHLYS